VNLIKEEKKNSDDQITSNLITSYFNLGLLYFYSKDYKEAIRTLNQIYLKTNKDYSPIKESEIIFIMILANIKLKQSDAIEILAKDYVTVYQRNNLHLPLRKKIVDEIYKNPFLDSGKMLANIKKTLDTSKEFDFVYSESLIDLKDWIQNH
jgi:tetratricopeptide (TPR) repeat protein